MRAELPLKEKKNGVLAGEIILVCGVGVRGEVAETLFRRSSACSRSSDRSTVERLHSLNDHTQPTPSGMSCSTLSVACLAVASR